MKLELIRGQLTACEQALEGGDHQQAVVQAYMTARLLLNQSEAWLQDSGSADLKKAYIGLVGVAGAVQTQLESMGSKQDPKELAEKLSSRIGQIQESFASAEEEYQQFIQLNQGLLDEEEELLKKKQELEDKKKKCEELKNLKEKQLVTLRKDVNDLEEKLETLNQECKQCQDVYQAVEAGLQENLQILSDMPESTGTQTLDKLIDQAKQKKDALQKALDDSAEPIRKVIEEVGRLQQMAKGGA